MLGLRRITDILNQLKQDWIVQLDEQGIAEACIDSGMSWIDSLLNPVTTIQIFFLQVLHGNTACQHLPRLARLPFTAAAYCKARMRIKLEALELLLCRSVKCLHDSSFDSEGRWFGHRVFFVDGSSFSMSDTPTLQSHFGQPGGQRVGCGFPTAHWLAMMHAGTGMITKMLTAPLRTHDMSQTTQLHPELRNGDVLVADRAFCSYAHLALLMQRGTQALFRVHQRTVVDFTPKRPHAHPKQSGKKKGLPRSRWLRSLGAQDQVVEWFKPTACPSWMAKEQFEALPEAITVRELRFQVRQKGFRTKEITLVTTLTDESKYSADELAILFRRRWEIETNFGHIKTTMNMDVLKCKTVDGVLKELQVFALIYNLVRQVMLIAAEQQRVDVHRLSFIDALRWLQTADLGDELNAIFVNPVRSDRYEPRVRKRRPKNYPLMKKPRCQLKKEMAGQ